MVMYFVCSLEDLKDDYFDIDAVEKFRSEDEAEEELKRLDPNGTEGYSIWSIDQKGELK